LSVLLRYTELLAHGRWFSPGTSAFSTTKTGRHDIAEILLKVALNQNKSKSKSIYGFWLPIWYLFMSSSLFLSLNQCVLHRIWFIHTYNQIQKAVCIIFSWKAFSNQTLIQAITWCSSVKSIQVNDIWHLNGNVFWFIITWTTLPN
jgi:hypothetical protein